MVMVYVSKIADIYEKKEDCTKAMKRFSLGTAKDNKHSQFQLGWIHDGELDVAKDHKLALKWCLDAVNKGNKTAQHNVDIILRKRQYELLKLKFFFSAKINLNEDIIQELRDTVSKMVTYYIRSNAVKDYEADEDNPGSDD
ncbi:hypothetical protein K501DRAFT_279971 [Backusella circina FSU 941]|nr:hypothetical protein K501DRAFT_279971 [Backusella circina FSU 941]